MGLEERCDPEVEELKRAIAPEMVLKEMEQRQNGAGAA